MASSQTDPVPSTSSGTSRHCKRRKTTGFTAEEVRRMLEESDFDVDDSASSKHSHDEDSLVDTTDSDNCDDDNDCVGSGDGSGGKFRDPVANVRQSEATTEWYDVSGTYLKGIVFTGHEEYKYNSSYPTDRSALTPHHVFSVFFDEEVLDLIVTETNRYAAQILDSKDISKGARLTCWTETNRDEIRKFFGIVMYMGLIIYPTIEDYWSTHPLFKNNILPQIMSRNRFQLLLRCIHFADNTLAKDADKTHKFREILDMLQRKFCAEYIPGETVAIDETMVPFRGRLSFLQYVPGKGHKYGIKVFKLCNSVGYTLRMVTYTGRTDGVSNTLAERIVLELMHNYLGEGRTVITDNYYTSVPLAKQLIEKRTNLVGTLRKNRRHLPDIVHKNIKKVKW